MGGGDISNLGDDRSNAQGSPCKRRGVGQEDAVTMTMLREILGEQTKTLPAQQREARGEIRTEIRTEIRALEQTVKGDLQTLERSCTSQFQDLQQGVQSAERGIHEVKTAQTGFERRLQALESRGSEAGAVASSAGGPRRTALVLGGWDPDTAATDMLKNAQNLIQELRLDLDTEDMIVPGVRRGLAILPFKPRDGETEEAMKQRLQEAMSKVRAANYLPNGRDRAAWLTYSRTFAERRRAALAGHKARPKRSPATDATGGRGRGSHSPGMDHIHRG